MTKTTLTLPPRRWRLRHHDLEGGESLGDAWAASRQERTDRYRWLRQWGLTVDDTLIRPTIYFDRGMPERKVPGIVRVYLS